jgi:acyl-CoA dehydrogenase
MDFTVDKEAFERLERVRQLGRTHIRPLGLEADRLGRPVPPDHDYFKLLLASGLGRTRWVPPEQAAAAREARPASAKADKKAPAGAARAGILIAEEQAYWDRGVSSGTPGPGMSEPAILSMGSDDQKRRFLGPFVNPEKPRWGAFAMTEPGAGSDVSAIRTSCVKDGVHWILNGEKSFSGNASRADWILVWATVDPALGRAGHRAFVVEKGTPGLGNFKIEKKMGIKGYESTSFTLQDCRVPAENLLGGEGHYASRAGFKGAMKTFNAIRPLIAANAVGIGRSALDEALAFAREHDRLHDPRVRDRLERIARKLRMARLLTLRAGWLADCEAPNMVEASMCKALAPAVAYEAASLGMELLGSVGGRGDHLIEKLFRDVKAMDIVEGTGQIQRIVMARHLVNLPNDTPGA